MAGCPICSNEMNKENRGGVEIDVCEEHGLWLDKGELFQITEAERHKKGSWVWSDIFRRPKRPFVHDGRKLSCPHCENELIDTPYQGVTFDRCVDHGVWLDSGELDALLNNLRLDSHYLSASPSGPPRASSSYHLRRGGPRGSSSASRSPTSTVSPSWSTTSPYRARA